jgi:hypothetical protein
MLREECRFRGRENKVPRKISGPKKNEVTKDLEKLYNVERHNLSASHSVVRAIKWPRPGTCLRK